MLTRKTGCRCRCDRRLGIAFISGAVLPYVYRWALSGFGLPSRQQPEGGQQRAQTRLAQSAVASSSSSDTASAGGAVAKRHPHKPYDGKYPCVLYFHWIQAAGFYDTIGKMNWMLNLARAYGCALIVPRPQLMLHPKHNNGTFLDGRLWWDKYIDVPPDLWEWFPDVVMENRTHVNTIPRRQQMEDYARGIKGKLITVWLEYTNKMFWDGQEVGAACCPMHLHRNIEGSVPKGYHIDLALLKPSALVKNTASHILQDFGAQGTLALHLRRGDRVMQYELQGYGACSDVPRVVNAARYVVLIEKLCVGVSKVFVMTDETDPSYLEALRTVLLGAFSKVLIERDIPALTQANDEYFVFQVLSVLGAISQCYLDFHPDRKWLMDVVCRGPHLDGKRPFEWENKT